MACPGRGVHQHYEKEKRQGQQTCRETRLNPRHQAERGGDKAGAREVRPKEMPRNPLRYDRGDGRRQREMFGAEGRDGRRVEKRPPRESACRVLAPFANGREEKSRPARLQELLQRRSTTKSPCWELRRKPRLPKNLLSCRSRRFLSPVCACNYHTAKRPVSWRFVDIRN